MKKKSSLAAMKALPPRDVDDYQARVPEAAHASFVKLRAAIWSVVPKEATEIISYRIPAIHYNGVLVWFAAFAKHCSLFPTAAVIEAFKDDLQSYSVSKGTIHFPVGKPLPIVLIKRIVKERIRRSGQKRRQ